MYNTSVFFAACQTSGKDAFLYPLYNVASNKALYICYLYLSHTLCIYHSRDCLSPLFKQPANTDLLHLARHITQATYHPYYDNARLTCYRSSPLNVARRCAVSTSQGSTLSGKPSRCRGYYHGTYQPYTMQCELVEPGPCPVVSHVRGTVRPTCPADGHSIQHIR